MLNLALIFTFGIISYFLYQIFQRRKFIDRGYKVIKKYERKKEFINISDIILIITWTILIFLKNEFAYIFIANFADGVITKVKNNDDIILTEAGLLFDKTYIEWHEIKRIYNEGENCLIVHSCGMKGKFKIKNIQRADILEKDIHKVFAGNN